MLISLKHIALIIGFTFSIQACTTEDQVRGDSRFIVQLTDNAIQKFQENSPQIEAHRTKKLQQWGKATGLILKAVPPSNRQRWIIKANTQDASHIHNLMNTANNDSDIKYIERDGIMTIPPHTTTNANTTNKKTLSLPSKRKPYQQHKPTTPHRTDNIIKPALIFMLLLICDAKNKHFYQSQVRY